MTSNGQQVVQPHPWLPYRAYMWVQYGIPVDSALLKQIMTAVPLSWPLFFPLVHMNSFISLSGSRSSSQWRMGTA